MPKAENDVQDTSINNPLQKIPLKMTSYFNIFNQSIFYTFFENHTLCIPGYITENSTQGFTYLASLVQKNVFTTSYKFLVLKNVFFRKFHRLNDTLCIPGYITENSTQGCTYLASLVRKNVVTTSDKQIFSFEKCIFS